MLSCNGFHAWIMVDGNVVLPVYGAEVDYSQNRATGWVPSEAGKRFSVGWRDCTLASNTSGYITVDGVKCGGKVVYRNGNGGGVGIKSEVVTSPTTSRPFIFSNMELTDDDFYLNQPSAKHIGEIVLEISWVAIGPGVIPHSGFRLPEAEKVHEKAKKAIVHRVKFGEEIFSPIIHTSVPARVLGTVATFVFRYRALDMLKANGIAPPDTVLGRLIPDIPQAGQKRKTLDVKEEPNVDETDEDAEMRALQTRLDVMKANKEGRQSKRVKSESEPVVIPRAIKFESIVKTEKKSDLLCGKVIDLT
ncbi:hypothetical protein BDQ12DRAFT_237529 [Crucibulum laeve]|uniref:DUF7918 domain-containing protein n=1 Tax=Crucibulum laeve TaxID=68775 RepID=A0A5C3LWD6_9AGAR|nr:hypothetical protein BDQ12DRAFT_237529 [Crucibulum laeve]